MYRVIVAPKANKELKKIALLYQEAISEAIEDLEDNPLSGKPLSRELTGRYSYKIGVYRIIYTVNWKDKKGFIMSAGHRSVVYKK